MQVSLSRRIFVSVILGAAISVAIGVVGPSHIAAEPITALHWQPLGEPGSGGWMTGVSISPHDGKRILLGGDMLGVGLSTDAGRTWQAATGFKSWEIGDFTWHPTDPKIVWAGTMSGPYCSLDGGKTWHEKRQGMPSPGSYFYSAPIEKVLYDPHDAAHLLAFGGSSRGWDGGKGNVSWGVVWESRDGGEQWNKLSTLTKDGSSAASDAKGVDHGVVSVAYAANSSSLLYAAQAGAGLYVSSDGGKTWTSRTEGLPSGNVNRVVAHPTDPNTVFVALDRSKPSDADKVLPGGIYKSTDAGKHWQSISNGLSQASDRDWNMTAGYKAFAVAPSNPNVMYTSDQAWNAGVLYVTRDGGANWHAAATKGNIGQTVSESQKGTEPVPVAYASGLAQTTFAIDPHDPNVALSVGSENLVETRDGGKTWTDGLNDYSPSTSGWTGRGYSGLCSWNVRFNPYKAGQVIVQAMDCARVWQSLDGMKSWTRPLQDPTPWFGGHDAVFTKDGHIYATSGQFGFYGIGRSVDGGKTWTVLAGEKHGLPDFMNGGNPDGIYALPADSRQVWACVGGKLLHSSDAGETWATEFDRPNLQWIAADPSHPTRFYVTGTQNSYVTDDGKTFTAIGGPHNNGFATVDSRGNLYLAAHGGDRGGLWCYRPGVGKIGTWTRIWDDGNVYGVAVDPTNSSRLALTTSDDPYHDNSYATGVWISADAGKTWTAQNDGLAMLRGHTIAFNPHDPSQLVFGAFGRGFWTTRWPASYVPLGGKHYASTADDAKFTDVIVPSQTTPSLHNGDMTAGTEIPDNWGKNWVGHGNLVVTRDTAVYKSGPASLRVASDGGDTQGQAAQMLDGTAGTTFTLSGVVKSTGNVKVNVAVQSFSGGWSPINFQQAGYVQNDADWVPFSKQITLPEGTSHVGIVLLLEGEGKAWLDNVTLTDVKLPPALP